MTRVEQLKKLVALAPNDPMSHYGLGLEYLKLQDWPAAIAAFADAVRVDAKYSAAYYHKARAELGGGQPDAAKATLAAGMATAQAVGDWHTKGEMEELLRTIP